MRIDMQTTFVRLDTGATVIWLAGASENLGHATEDGIHAVCSRALLVSPDRDPSPSTYDRSNDLMTCDRCAERVRRLKPPSRDPLSVTSSIGLGSRVSRVPRE